MGQVLHGSATTTEAVRRAIQHSQESLRALAKRYGINPKTVAKWKKRSLGRRPADRPQGAALDGAVDRGGGDHRRLPAAHAVAARRLPLRASADDPAPDALIAAPLPAAPRHQPVARCGGRQAAKRSSSATRSASSTSTSPRCRTEEGKLYLSSPSTAQASSPSSSCTRRPHRARRGNFLAALVEAVPYRIHTVLTDNGIQFTEPSGDGWTPEDIKPMLDRKQLFRATPSSLPAPDTASSIG